MKKIFFSIGTLIALLLLVIGFTTFVHASLQLKTGMAQSATDDNTTGTLAWSNPTDLNTDPVETDDLNSGFSLVSDSPIIPGGSANGVTFHPTLPFLVVPNEEGEGFVVVKLTDNSLVDVSTILPTINSVEDGTDINNDDTLDSVSMLQTESAVFSADGNHLAVSGILKGLWHTNGETDFPFIMIINSTNSDASQWTVAKTIFPVNEVYKMAFSPNGSYLATTNENSTPGPYLIIYNTNDWSSVVNDFSDISNEATAIAIIFSSDNKYLFVAQATTVKVLDTNTWDVISGTPDLDAANPDYSIVSVLALALSHDGHHLAASTAQFGGSDTIQDVYILDISNSDPTQWTISKDITAPNDIGSGNGVWSMSYSPDDSYLSFAYTNSPYFALYDIGADDIVDTGLDPLDGNKSGVNGQGVEFSPDGNYFAVAQNGGKGLSLISLSQPALAHYLVANHFGLQVPKSATITGVVATVSKGTVAPTDRVKDNDIRLFSAGSVVGDNKADEDSSWSTTGATDATYGSNSDKWGATLTPDIVNASDFGVAISANVLFGKAEINTVSVTVYYANSSGAHESSGSYVSSPSVISSEPPVTTTPNPTTPSVPATSSCTISTLLKFGSTGLDVKCLQTTLGAIVIDGIFGTQTQAAVLNFQRTHPPLDVDGVVGPLTKKALGL